MTFLLPDTCETCGACFVSRTISKRYADTEECEYKCGARYHMYYSHKRRDIQAECPKSPNALKKSARIDEINRAVAKALNSVDATYEECKAFSHRMEYDNLGLYGGKGIWELLHVKRPKD